MAVKKTADLIPFCHPIPLEDCTIKIRIDSTNTSTEDKDKIIIDCITKTTGKTGIEMEALIGASHTALTVYDMLKAATHNLTITNVELISKTGGKRDYDKEKDELAYKKKTN